MSWRGIRRGNAAHCHRGGPTRLIKRIMDEEVVSKSKFPSSHSNVFWASGRWLWGVVNRKTKERIWDINEVMENSRTLYSLEE